MSLSSDLWPDVLKNLKENVRQQQFDTWFKPLQVDTISAGQVCLRVPNSFYKAWLSERYATAISNAIYAVSGERVSVTFKVQPESFSHDQPADEDAQSAAVQDVGTSATSTLPAPRQRITSEMRLNSLYTFDNFVVGPSNSLPHAAAMAVADSPSQAYNPLFIHASVGMGKTHLVHAICHALLAKRADLNILYLSCEGFVNHFISAVEHGEIEKFRYRYRHVDVLLVDDIHSLQGKERTQEEFFHTFNTLHNDHKQIVLSSDSPPSEIPKLEERLISRFNWGLVTRIDPPIFETRVAIVKKKAQLRGRSFPGEVIEFIADAAAKNVRELEGAVVTVIGYASLANKPISLSLAREALRDTLKTARMKPGMDVILEAVIREYHVRLSDLQSKRRSKALAFPRQVCMFLARRFTDLSLAEIGGFFGGRDHTTVIHACERINLVLTLDPEQAARIAHVERIVLNNGH